MSIFIKPGFWDEKRIAPKHWLDLNTLITKIATTLIPPPEPSVLPYKEYAIRLFQSGTNAPVPYIVNNTLGFVPTWERITDGAVVYYTLTGDSTTSFPLNKTYIEVLEGGDGPNKPVHLLFSNITLGVIKFNPRKSDGTNGDLNLNSYLFLKVTVYD